MLAHTAHAVHSILQAPQLAQPGWLHLNSGCHCHHDPAHSPGPTPSRYAPGLLSMTHDQHAVTPAAVADVYSWSSCVVMCSKLSNTA